MTTMLAERRSVTTTTIADRRSAPDDGFGLMEIVVAMLVLSILAISLLPLLVQGVRQSATNSTTATANQLVSTQMHLAQTRGTVCADVRAMAGTTTLRDPRDVLLTVTTTVGSCPTGGIGTVRVSTSVVRGDTGETVSSATTLVYVAS